ncbi:MAG: MAPEG family protein [Rhodobacteraceae bacterium]|nr:MAPEG family protein [Paracoccaceae bacterium]
MSGKQRLIAAEMAAGFLWALLLLWLGWRATGADGSDPLAGAALALAFPALVAVAMVGRLAQRRFFDARLIDGGGFAPGSPAEIDQRVLTNSVEQLVLAACIWPALALRLGAQGAGVVLALGVGLALTRILFWVGYHRAPALRGFGFAAGFYPTVLAGVWTVWTLI